MKRGGDNFKMLIKSRIIKRASTETTTNSLHFTIKKKEKKRKTFVYSLKQKLNKSIEKLLRKKCIKSGKMFSSKSVYSFEFGLF